jgi:hypothetical protein
VLVWWGDVSAENLYVKNVTREFNLFGESANSISDCIAIADNNNSIEISIGFSPSIDTYITGNIILFTGSNNSQSGISIGAPRSVNIYNA